MSKSDTMWIAFPNGGNLPASIAGGKERSIPAREPVKVPRTYGEQLTGDRFAYETEAPKKPTTVERQDAARKAALDEMQAKADAAARAQADAEAAAQRIRDETPQQSPIEIPSK